jgi:hypothetical protein
LFDDVLPINGDSSNPQETWGGTGPPIRAKGMVGDNPVIKRLHFINLYFLALPKK